MSTFLHDPQAVLDYTFDWSTWLGDGETITATTVTGETGITVGVVTNDASTVTAWLSGGTAGTSYRVVCHVTTSDGRQDDRTLRLSVTER